MARKKSITLTDAELRLMDVLWTNGPSNTTDVLKAIPGDSKLAYTTVLTTLRILEEKGIKPAGDADEENLAELARLSKVP